MGLRNNKTLSFAGPLDKRVKRDVGCSKKGKQKDAPPASRKQLNTETDDNGKGKQKGAPKGGKTKTKDAGKGKQDGKPSGAKLAPTDDGKEKRKKTDKPEEKDASAKAKDVNKSKRDREDNEEDVEFVKARKIRVSTGKPKTKTRKVVARQQVVEEVEEEDDEDEDKSLYETPNSDDYDSDSSNGAHGEGREEAFVDEERTDDEDDFDDDEEDNREEASLTRTGHTARATVRPSSGNAGVVVTNPVAQSIARVQVTDLPLGGKMPIRGMLKRESLRIQQNHVADRIRVFVKTDIFRRIKFINSNAMFQKAITVVMDHENVPQNWRGQYQSIYESTFNDALNTTPSSCEQSGGRIVRESLAHLQGIRK
ncbi:hypothetical protein MHU86_143 [Fragilaria crotonensis]|nr:hypothetical protein MHU86_143 [Fragilaria crotonensis]